VVLVWFYIIITIFSLRRSIMPFTNNSYDITVMLFCFSVGAGTAGCVLANRLSADPRIKVLLLESGVEGINRDVMGMPATAFDHHRTNIDWKYMSEPQKICCQSFENQVWLPHVSSLVSLHICTR